MGIALNPFYFLIDFIYSSPCEICKTPLDGPHRVICRDCWNKLEYWNREVPVRFFALEEAGISPSFKKAKAVFQFSSTCRDIIHLLKYNRRPSLGTKLGEMAGTFIKDDFDFSQADFLVPVPLHPVKQRERGYNQAALLVEAISRITKIPCPPDIMKRVRYSESQTKLDFSKRRNNVANLFTIVKKDLVQNKKVIVVDDVITSGSTMDACGETLLKAGASEVLALAMTHPTRKEDISFI
jgi:ComF family protein